MDYSGLVTGNIAIVVGRQAYTSYCGPSGDIGGYLAPR